MNNLYSINTEGIFKVNYSQNQDTEIKKYKKEIKILEQENIALQTKYKSMEDIKLTISCVDILNKILVTLMMIYILTVKTHSSSKVIDQGFSFYDWICFFVCNISLSTSLPKLVNWIAKNDTKKKRH